MYYVQINVLKNRMLNIKMARAKHHVNVFLMKTEE